MLPDDRHLLLFGPYRSPAYERGDRASCLVRDCDVVITGWTDARMPWPMCVPLGGRSRPSILVDEELARAVRHESAAAVKYWWGVSTKVAWKWRQALGVGRMDSEGSRRLILAAGQAGADAMKQREFTPEEREKRSARAKQVNQAQHMRKKPPRPLWTAADLELLAAESDDAQVAAATGRTVNAVRAMRWKVETAQKIGPADRAGRIASSQSQNPGQKSIP